MLEPYTIPDNTHIGSVHLKVSDLNRSLDFYHGMLGFDLMPDISENGTEAHLSPTGSEPEVIRLTEIPGGRPKPPRTTGLYHVAIRLPDRPALGSLFRRLLEKRYPLQGAADHLVSEAIYLADPDGNGLELYIDRARQEWPVLNGQVQMSTDPLDAVGLLEEASEARDWTGIAPGTDIGHMHLQVSDLTRAEAFYCGILGFQVTQRSYPGALFVSAGGYHHHIGMNVWSSRRAPPPPKDAVGLEAFQVAVADASVRAELLRRLEQSGVPTIYTTDDGVAGEPFATSDPDGIKMVIR